MSGKEVKKKKHLFGLRIRFPPAPPNSDDPASRGMERASHEITIKGCKSTKASAGTRLDMKPTFEVLKFNVLTFLGGTFLFQAFGFTNCWSVVVLVPQTVNQ